MFSPPTQHAVSIQTNEIVCSTMNEKWVSTKTTLDQIVKWNARWDTLDSDVDASPISIHVCSKTLLHHLHFILDVSWHDSNTTVLSHVQTQFQFRLWWCWKDLWTWRAFMSAEDFWRSSENQPRSQASLKRVERWRNRLWMSFRYSPHILIWWFILIVIP